MSCLYIDILHEAFDDFDVVVINVPNAVNVRLNEDQVIESIHNSKQNSWGHDQKFKTSLVEVFLQPTHSHSFPIFDTTWHTCNYNCDRAHTLNIMGACCSSREEKVLEIIKETKHEDIDDHDCHKTKQLTPNTHGPQKSIDMDMIDTCVMNDKNEISDNMDQMFSDIESDFYQFNDLKDIDGRFMQYVREIDAYNDYISNKVKQKTQPHSCTRMTPKRASSISYLIVGFANYGYNQNYNSDCNNTDNNKLDINNVDKVLQRIDIPKELVGICCQYLYVSRNEYIRKIFIDDYIVNTQLYSNSGLSIEIPIKFRLIDDKGEEIVDNGPKPLLPNKHEILDIHCNSHNIFQIGRKSHDASIKVKVICLTILKQLKISGTNNQHKNAHDIVITFDSKFKRYTSGSKKIQYILQGRSSRTISHRWSEGCIIVNCPLFDIQNSFVIGYNKETNIFIHCNNFFAINQFHKGNKHKSIRNECLNNQLILKCNGKITYEKKETLKIYFGSISIKCHEMFISGLPNFGTFSPNRGIILLCDKDIDIEDCQVLSWGYIYIQCNNLISNGRIHFVNVKHKFQKKSSNLIANVCEMNKKPEVNQFNKYNWNTIKDYEKGFKNINGLQFDNKNKRLNAMILHPGYKCKDINSGIRDNDCNNIDGIDSKDTSIVTDSNKWMFLNVTNDVKVLYIYGDNDYSHSDAVESIYMNEEKNAVVSYNWFDTLTDALIVKCSNWNAKIGYCKTYNGFRVFESNNLNDIK